MSSGSPGTGTGQESPAPEPQAQAPPTMIRTCDLQKNFVDLSLGRVPATADEESLEEETLDGELTSREHISSRKFCTDTSLSWGFKTKEVRVTKIPNHFQSKRTENLLILVAFSIGLGSMWRFPYLCHRNGGGSFLLIYLVLLLLLGIPLLYMELVVGQWLRMDNIQAWKQLVPWLGGIGYASILACVLVSSYNSVLVSWSLFYLSQSFIYPPPWEHCPLVVNISMADLSCLRTVPHQYFWYHSTLRASDRLEEGIEVLVLNLSLCLFAAWIFLYITMVTRIKIPVLMLIFTIFFPCVILLCFFVRSLFLKGAVGSLRRLVTTEVSTLTSLDTWRQAGGHVLYSLGLGMGTIITFSSYQSRGDSFVKLAAFLAVVNVVTSVLTTSIIFLVLEFWITTSGSTCVEMNVSNLIQRISEGMLPQEAWPPRGITGRPPWEYLDWITQLPKHLQEEVFHVSLPCSILVQKEKFMEGPGLAYVVFSQVVSLFPSSSFWAIMFFLALVIIELGTMITLLEGIVLSLQNCIPTFSKYPKLVPVVICLGGLLGSLVFTSRPGSYVVFLFDDHLVPTVLAVIVVFQNLSLAWIYGARRFRAELFGQLGCLLWTPFSFLWSYVTLPMLLALLTICFLNFYHKKSLYYISWNDNTNQEMKQPYLKTALGWVIVLSTLALLPVPIYPLQHWWYLEDSSDIVEKSLSSRKRVSGPNKGTQQWPLHPLRKPTLRSQDKDKSLLTASKSPYGTFLQPKSLGLSRDTNSFSSFSLPGGSIPLTSS